MLIPKNLKTIAVKTNDRGMAVRVMAVVLKLSRKINKTITHHSHFDTISGKQWML